MTTQSYSYVDNATQSGSGAISWSGLSSLTSSSSGVASASGTSGRGDYLTTTRTINLDTPEYSEDITLGARFTSMDVQFKAWNGDAGGTGYFSVTQNGTERFTDTLSDLSNTGTRTYSGNEAYWGFQGDLKDIANQIRDGSIKFHYYAVVPQSSSYSVVLEDFVMQLEHTEPDTKRASILVTLP